MNFSCLPLPSQTSTSTGLSKGVSAQCLFDLLVSLEGETYDALDALELVKAEKPLRSLGKLYTYIHSVPCMYLICRNKTKLLFFVADFCYGNEDLTFSISEAIKLCVTVVAYAPESFRRYGNISRRHSLFSYFQLF